MKKISLLEVSYEVANKVGGINTVLRSKVRDIQSNVGEYITIGPYYQDKAEAEFVPGKPPQDMQDVFDSILNNHGIKCYYGRWKVEDEPKCILIDFGPMRNRANEIKGQLWEQYKIDSLHADSWYDEPVVWSRCAGILIEELVNNEVLKHKPVAHFHEWLTGAGLLYLKNRAIDVGTVFTTHSTVLGRAIAETGREDLYDLINGGLDNDEFVSMEKIYEYKIESKHMMESACAHNADVFTAVSETIRDECLFMLGKEPDMILPNGLNMDHFPKLGEMSREHEKSNKVIKGFLEKHFSPYYKLDLDNTLLFYISGRFEFRNKGIDIFIDALGNLDDRLKARKTKKNIVAFIFVPAQCGRRVGRSDNPPVSPFTFDSDNAITSSLRENGLTNDRKNHVKIIFYPIYLSKDDGLIGLNYYDAIRGFDLGVFPSYYESWGYTPVESAACGLQSVTTDLSGFGKFIKRYLRRGEQSIFVLHRSGREYDDVVRELENVMHGVTFMIPKKMQESRIRAKKLSLMTDWKYLVKYYLRAYDMAIKASGI